MTSISQRLLLVELDEEDERPSTPNNYAPPAMPVVNVDDHSVREPYQSFRAFSYGMHHPHPRPTSRMYESSSQHVSVPVFMPNPSNIFSFPTPTSYSAHSNPTQNLAPCASGSASELFKCIVKKPNVVQLEINDEMQSNAKDVTTQFLAELRVYTTVTRHRNIAAFLGCLENVGMVLEYIEGRTLWDVVRERPLLTRAKKIEYHNQLLDGLTHLHSFGLSHGDLSLLNVQVTHSSDTIKLLDFGRSVAADSRYISPDDEMEDPAQTPHPPPYAPRPVSRFASTSTLSTPKLPYASLSPSSLIPAPPSGSQKTEQIHPGTRPFCAPEILRGECQDALLADAYSFGIILVCLDRCDPVDIKPWDQRKDLLPKGFLDGLEVFRERCAEYLRRWDWNRRKLMKEDIIKFDDDVQMAL